MSKIMLTENQDKSLQAALKDFIELLFTSRHPYTKLYYYTRTDSFFADDCEYEPDDGLYLISRETIKLDWNSGLSCSYSEELEKILINSDKTEYNYSQHIIDNAKELAQQYDYDPEDYTRYEEDVHDILKESGAADFILEEMIKENIRHYTEEDNTIICDLKNEAIEAYEEY